MNLVLVSLILVYLDLLGNSILKMFNTNFTQFFCLQFYAFLHPIFEENIQIHAFYETYNVTGCQTKIAISFAVCCDINIELDLK